MNGYDLWWGRLVRAIALLLGIAIAVTETYGDHFQHPWAYAAAGTFIGLPLAGAFETAVRLLADPKPTDETELAPEHPAPPRRGGKRHR